MNTTYVNVRLPIDVAKELDKSVEETGVMKKRIVENALREYLKMKPRPPIS